MRTACWWAAWALGAGAVAAQDEIERRGEGGRNEKLRGRILRETPRGVSIDVKGVATLVMLGDIVEVRYERQPTTDVQRAKASFEAGQYEDAVKDAERVYEIVREGLNANLKAAALFGVVRARVALAKADPATTDAAAAVAATFAKEYPNTRHEFAFQQAFGELCLSRGEYDAAGKAFAALKESETPGLRERAVALEGLALMEKGDLAAAVKNFDLAASLGRNVPEAKADVLAARIFKAEAALRGQPDAARLAATEQQLRLALKEAGPEDRLAKAYGHNALGDVLRMQKRPPKDTLLEGYLRVLTMYPDDVQQLARALFQAQALFQELGQGDRADACREQLRGRFPNTKWAKLLP